MQDKRLLTNPYQADGNNASFNSAHWLSHTSEVTKSSPATISQPAWMNRCISAKINRAGETKGGCRYEKCDEMFKQTTRGARVHHVRFLPPLSFFSLKYFLSVSDFLTPSLWLQIVGDAVGWGFVVRGNTPCHIQAVEPCGPAAAAGMKVGHHGKRGFPE